MISSVSISLAYAVVSVVKDVKDGVWNGIEFYYASGRVAALLYIFFSIVELRICNRYPKQNRLRQNI